MSKTCAPRRLVAVIGVSALVLGLVLAAPAGATQPVPHPAGHAVPRQVIPAEPAGIGLFNAAVVYNGQPQDFYWDSASGSLRHAWYSGRWNTETLDGRGSGYAGARTTDVVGQYAATVVYAGQLHVWYRDDTAGTLRHAWWTGTTWRFEILDGTGSGYAGHTSDDTGYFNAVVIYAGQLHVFTLDHGTDEVLRHDWWDGAAWHLEALDGTGSAYAGHTSDEVGSGTTVAIYGGQLQVFTVDDSTGSLDHDWWDGARWNFETLDGSASAYPDHSDNIVGTYTSVTVYGGQLHVFTSDFTTGSTILQSGGVLRHDWWDGTRWHLEALDGSTSAYAGHTADSVGLTNAVAVYGGQLHVFTFDDMSGSLRHDWWDGTRWRFEAVDGTGSPYGGHTADSVGVYSALALYGGQLHVWYFDTSSGSLRHAWSSGPGWNFETLDRTLT